MAGGHRAGIAKEFRLAVGLDQCPSPLQQGLGGRPLEAGMGAQQPFPDNAKGLAKEACAEASRFPQKGGPIPGRPLEADRHQPGFPLEKSA